jgi:hypothetical protein
MLNRHNCYRRKELPRLLKVVRVVMRLLVRAVLRQAPAATFPIFFLTPASISGVALASVTVKHF